MTTNAVFEKKLIPAQIEEMRIALRGRHGMTKKLVARCEDADIASRAVVFEAIKAESYDGENGLHRLVTHEAVKMLNEIGVFFKWQNAEPELSSIEA